MSVLIFFVLTSIATYSYLTWRQLQTIKLNRDIIPDPYPCLINKKDNQKASDYTTAVSYCSLINWLFCNALIVFWVGYGVNATGVFWGQFNVSPIQMSVFVILSVFILNEVLTWPALAYKTFVIDSKFDFNQQSKGFFIFDQLKQLLFASLIISSNIIICLILQEFTGRLWWLYEFGFLILLGIVLLRIYPAYIAPLFNKYDEIKEPKLRRVIEDLLARCSLDVVGVFRMHASRRSRHSNAFFSGIGKGRRVVLFDNLINLLTLPELEAVLAHEIGHSKNKHVAKYYGMLLLLIFVSLSLTALMMERNIQFHMIIANFIVLLPLLKFFIAPLRNYIVRRWEIDADNYAIHKASANSLDSALMKLYQNNATILMPDWLYAAYFYSHPTIDYRIQNILKQDNNK